MVKWLCPMLSPYCRQRLAKPKVAPNGQNISALLVKVPGRECRALITVPCIGHRLVQHGPRDRE